MRIAVTTLGCKVNQYDSAVIHGRLEGHHSMVPFEEAADCYIINTCTVTDRADWEARQLVRRAKRRNPAAKILVTGCYAQVSPDEVARVSGVDYVVGLNRLDDLVRFVENDSAIGFVPYFARYAYETYVAPKESHQSIADLSAGELTDLAAVLQSVLVRYDNLWRLSFPYVLALHQAPTDGDHSEGFHFHIQIHPPLRMPNLLKYLAGPEIGGGNFLSDTSPEQKAAELRGLSSIHYKAEQSSEGG